MIVNGLKLPDSFVGSIARPKPLDHWRPKKTVDAYGVDAYGQRWSQDDVIFYPDQATIQKETSQFPMNLRIGSLTPDEIEEWNVTDSHRPGWIPFITDFSQIVCFGETPSAGHFCFDYREDAEKPSVIFFEDGRWRRLAPDFDAFISLFKSLYDEEEGEEE